MLTSSALEASCPERAATSTGEPLRVLVIDLGGSNALGTTTFLSNNLGRVTHVLGSGGVPRTMLSGHLDGVVVDTVRADYRLERFFQDLREKTAAPIIVLCDAEDEADRIALLESCADDFLIKPFSPRELLARVRAHARRATGGLAQRSTPVAVSGLVLDPAAMRATRNGVPLPLTAHEFALLLALARRPGRILTREQLLVLLTGDDEQSFDRSIDLAISRLRRKLGDDPKQPQLIKTVRGMGYLLANDPALLG